MNKELATCRACGKVLKGKPYYMGGPAYDISTNEQVKVNFYGGYVCSYECDLRASKELEASMPGNTGSGSLSSPAQISITKNWH